MKQSGEIMHNLLPYDLALKIASSLEVYDLCALGNCSRFWRELCGSDCIWASLCRDRWPFLDLLQKYSTFDAESSEVAQTIEPNLKVWRISYIKNHHEMAQKATALIEFVEHRSSSESLEIRDFQKAIEEMLAMQLGFEDVRLFLFKPRLNVLLNLVGLDYCINWLRVPAESVIGALTSCEISERQVCIKWWKLGRWVSGFRLQDESLSRCVSLRNLAMDREEEVLGVLHRGVVHEVFRVQITAASATPTPWSCQSTQTH